MRYSARLVLVAIVMLLGGLALLPASAVQALPPLPLGSLRPDGACFYYEITPESNTIIFISVDMFSPPPPPEIRTVVPGETIQGYVFLPAGSQKLFLELPANAVQMIIQPDGFVMAMAAGSGAVRLVDGPEAQACDAAVIPDGRLNRFDVAAPVAFYPDGEGGLKFYVIDAEGNGQMVLHVTAEQIAAVVSPPAENTLIAEGAGIALYRLTTGEFQVNMGEYVVIFDVISTFANTYHP